MIATPHRRIDLQESLRRNWDMEDVAEDFMSSSHSITVT